MLKEIIEKIRKYIDSKTDLEYTQHMCYDHGDEKSCGEEADKETAFINAEKELKDSIIEKEMI